MRFLPTIRDSRGEESVTLTFVLASWLVATAKMLFGFFSVTIGTAPAPVIVIASAQTGPGEYGAACALIIGIWLGREYTEKRTKPKDEHEHG